MYDMHACMHVQLMTTLPPPPPGSPKAPSMQEYSHCYSVYPYTTPVYLWTIETAVCSLSTLSLSAPGRRGLLIVDTVGILH